MNPNPAQREFAVDVVRRLQEAGFQAFWAGGCVRDLLLGRVAQDYDVATDARPDAVRNLFGKKRTLAVGASFGVIIVRGPDTASNVEVATFRTEGPYADGRRPDHVTFSTPEEDAQRRDFTINGMFYDPIAEQVHDYVGGEQDLGAGIIRAIGDPHARMREDKLRLLRAVRFTATLDFQLDPVTFSAVRDMAAEIRVVSVERISQELKKMLVDAHRVRAMELAETTGLLHAFLPELQVCTLGDVMGNWLTTLHRLKLLDAPSFELALAALLYPVAESPRGVEVATNACRRLRLSNHEIDAVTWLLSERHALDDAKAIPLARFKRVLAHPRSHELVQLVRGQRLATQADLAPVLHAEEFLRATPREVIDPPPLLSGDVLVARGLKPGPRFREILERIRDAQLNEEIATTDEAVALLDRILTEKN